MTQRLDLRQQIDPQHIARAADIIRGGGLVAFPTETVYGLGANALDAEAVEKIFVAKGRPPNDPLIVHLAAVDELPRVTASLPPIAIELARVFMPGALTLVLPKANAVPANVTSGLNSVAVRVPAHPIAQALIQTAGVPIAAPSANRFGRTSPTTAQHVLEDLDGRIDLLLDGGATTIGVESTVLDLTRTPPTLLRPGGVPREDLEALIGRVALTHGEANDNAPQLSPGLLSQHYAPHAELVLCLGESPAVLEKIKQVAGQALADGRRVGLLLANDDLKWFGELPVSALGLGNEEDLGSVARNLYAGMRALDGQGVDVIIARDFGNVGLGLAIRDRLMRAATLTLR